MSERIEEIRQRLDRWENSLVEVTPATMPVSTDNLRYLLDRVEALEEVAEAARGYANSGAVNERDRLRHALDRLEDTDAGR